MKSRAAAGLILIVLAVIGVGVGGWLIWSGLRKMKLEGTTDEARLKGTIRGAFDSWLGYSVLDSKEFSKRMRAAGYRLDWTDDGADYDARFKALSEGEYDFVVATVDSYVLGGKAYGYPGPIVAVLDESKGDAVIARDAVKDVNGLDDPAVSIAFTPASPSEFLLKSMGSHFGLPKLRTKGAWRVETNGSEEAYKLLLDGKVDAAVLWEPDVSMAKAQPGFHYLMGSDMGRRLIVDILIARQDFIAENPDVLKTFLREYFLALKAYRDDPDRLVSEVAAKTKRPEDVLKTAMKGVAFASFTDNCEEWLGLPMTPGAKSDEGLVDTIESTLRVLLDEGDLTDNPFVEGNPYSIISTRAVSALIESGLGGARFSVPGAQAASSGAAIDVKPLDESAWKSLRTVGSLKLQPIVFQSGTSVVTTAGKNNVDVTAENLEHYPNFRILLRGHTAPGGDEQANRELSLERAESVARYLKIVHRLDEDQIRAEGLGSSDPLPQGDDEGRRAYRYRLPRVEFVLLTEEI